MAGELFVEFSQESKLLFVRFPERIEAKDVKQLKKSITSWMERNEPVLVFDMRGTSVIDDQALDVLVNFLKLIHLNEKRVTSTKPEAALYESLQEKQVADLFFFRES